MMRFRHRRNVGEKAEAARPRHEGTGAEGAISCSRIPVQFSLNMGPSGFEPESSGPEPPRIDQATPRTRATRGTTEVSISVARSHVSMRDRFGFLFSVDLSCSASGYSAARLD